MGAAVTVVDAISDNKTYYNCPSCGKRVWAYGSYVGNVCWGCPGTIASGTLSTFEAVHPGGLIMTPIKKHALDMDNVDAKFQGVTKVSIQYNVANHNILTTSEEKDEIAEYETRACRIMHGSISWLTKLAKDVVTAGQADDIDHWWVNIETKNGRYYNLQFRGGSNLIELRQCKSLRECNLTGLAEAWKKEDASHWKEGHYNETFYGSNAKKVTMGDVASWLESRQFSPYYKLVTHNCQDLCKAFYRKF